MENESKKQSYLLISVSFLLIVVSIGGVWMLHSAENRLTEEHSARMVAEEKNADLQLKNMRLYDAATENDLLLKQCRASSSQTLSDSVARLKTRTLLVTSLPETPAGAQVSLLPAMQRVGLLGLLMDVVQASQKQTGRAQPPAQVWILPTSVEPMFAGDVDRAWVIHSDVATGKPVDTPHHPFPVKN